jgi:hypothetical protein
MIDTGNHQGKFGADYIRLLASAAGLAVWTPDVDLDGIDLGIRWVGRDGHRAAAGIDVQVKSWSNPRKVGGDWHFNNLNESQFNQLAGDDHVVPRYLFLVVVPKSQDLYAEMLTDGMLLRYQSYYVSLRDEPLVEHPSQNRKLIVPVPIGNVLTTKTLRTLTHPNLGKRGFGQ